MMAYLAKQGWIAGEEGLPGGMVTLWGAKGGNGDVHVATALFAAWGAAMVSKTLHIPKP